MKKSSSWAGSFEVLSAQDRLMDVAVVAVTARLLGARGGRPTGVVALAELELAELPLPL